MAIHLSRQPVSIATVWFANAAAIAVLACRPARRWAELLGAVVAGNLGANLAYGDPLGVSATFLPANAIEVLVGTCLLRRGGAIDHLPDDAGPFMRVLLTSAVWPPLAGATIGAATIHWHGYARFTDVWDDWYVGSVLGSIAMLPFALAALKRGWPLWAAQVFTLPTAAFALLCAGVALFAMTWLQPRSST